MTNPVVVRRATVDDVCMGASLHKVDYDVARLDQMKHRRVQGQDGFEKALQAHAGAILRCVAEAGPW